MASNKSKTRSLSRHIESDVSVEDFAETIIGLPLDKPILESTLLSDYFTVPKPSKHNEIPLYSLHPLRTELEYQRPTHEYLILEHTSQFCKWLKYLEYGFNVLIYGVGSKISLLDNFFDLLEMYPTHRIKVFAFNPNFSLRKLLSKMLTFLAIETKIEFDFSSSLTNMLTATLTALDICHDNDPFYSITILINSLDAPTLKSEDAQLKLSKLVNHDSIRLVASADHVNIARTWSLSVLSQYNFVSFATPTYEPYSSEISYSRDSLRIFSKTSADSALQGLKHVVMSMTTTQHQVLKEIVEICNDQEKIQVGVKELLQVCKSQFIVANEKQLMDYLMESLDHQVLIEKRTQRGERILTLQYPVKALEITLKLFNQED